MSSKDAADLVVKQPRGNEIDSLLGLSPLKNYQQRNRQSLVNARESCSRKGLFNQAFGLRTIHRRRGLDESSYAHIALQLFAKGLSSSEVSAQIDKYLRIVCQQSKETDAKDRAQDACVGLFLGEYAWKKLKVKLDQGTFKILHVEYPLNQTIHVGLVESKADLPQLTSIPVQGQIDMILQGDDGSIWFWDSKFIGMSPMEATADLRNSLQPFMYLKAGSLQLGKPVAGFIFGLVMKPGLRRRGMGSRGELESLPDYIKRCEDKLVLNEESDPPFVLYSHKITRQEEDECLARLLRHVTAMEKCRNHFHFPPTGSSCRQGNMTCEFLPLCSRDPRQWYTTIHVDKLYTTERDPLDSVSDRPATQITISTGPTKKQKSKVRPKHRELTPVSDRAMNVEEVW